MQDTQLALEVTLAFLNPVRIYFTRRTDHDLDNRDPHLPLGDVVQDLYSTDPTRELRPRSCRTYGSDPATWAIVDDADTESICPGMGRC